MQIVQEFKMPTEEEFRKGFAGNSFLIWEMLEDSINSISGCYFRMHFWETMRGKQGNRELMVEYLKKSRAVSLEFKALKNKSDENVLIDYNVKLWREYHIAKAIERKEYAGEAEAFDCSAPLNQDQLDNFDFCKDI